MCQISRLLLWKSPQECQNVTIEFCFVMRVFYELRYTVIIEIVWTFYLKSVPAKFQKYSKHISWVISGTSSSKLSCNPRHPSRNISCNHCHHLLQPSWRRKFSTSNNQKTRVDSDINSDYKASSFDKLYIRRRKWDTAGFVRAHKRKYWNALTVGHGHADDGCSCNHRAVPPSAKSIIIRFTHVNMCRSASVNWQAPNYVIPIIFERGRYAGDTKLYQRQTTSLTHTKPLI